MYFLALATDYDGTIAHHGVVDAPTNVKAKLVTTSDDVPLADILP